MTKKPAAHKLLPPVPAAVERVAAFVVYRIRCNRTRRSYIGITRKTAEARLREHVQFALNGRSNSKLAHAIRQYGRDAFSVEVLARTRSVKRVAELERHYIAEYKTDVRGYNTHPGGNIGGQTGTAVTYAGKTYRSISELCRTHGLDYRIFKKRRAKGWSFEQCVTGREFFGGKAIAIEFNGIVYPSIKHFCIAIGKNQHAGLCRPDRHQQI